MVQERCDIGYIAWQLDHARTLMGTNAFVKQLFYGITAATTDPNPCWIDFVNAAYDRGLKPVLRLEGEHGGAFWRKPQPDWPGNYAGVAQGFARVVARLPRRSGRMLYIQLWNEPNLNLEWGGEANPIEYGQFLEQTAGAIRTATGGDPRIVILNAALSPGGDIPPTTFMQRMFSSVPNSRWAFDLWAAHSYPGNYPPELNIHRGQAVRNDVTIDSYVPQVQVLAANGRAVVPVFLSETGYLLGQQYDRRYPAVTEANRAEYMRRAFQYQWRAWPELMGVAPYQLSDPNGTWGGWNWVEGDNSRHAQYDSVLALDKSYPYASGQLTIAFQARAAGIGGTYTSAVEVGASNFGVSPQSNVAAVVVVQPQPTRTPTAARTATPTATATASATASPAPTPTPTATLFPTESPMPSPTTSSTPGATASPTGTITPDAEVTPTLTASAWPTATDTATSTAPATATGTATVSPAATRSPTVTPSSTRTASLTPTRTSTRTATPTRTASPTPTPTATPVAFLVTTVGVGQEPHGLAVDSSSWPGLCGKPPRSTPVGHRREHGPDGARSQPGQRQRE